MDSGKGTRESGTTTIEIVVVFVLLGFALIALAKLHMIAISAGTAAETSSIAGNLARARMEELLALPPDRVMAQHDTRVVEQVPAGRGRPYMVRTTVDASDPARLDLTVAVSWQVGYGSACLPTGSSAECPGNVATYTRTLETRLRRP